VAHLRRRPPVVGQVRYRVPHSWNRDEARVVALLLYISLHEIATVSFAEKRPEWGLGNSCVLMSCGSIENRPAVHSSWPRPQVHSSEVSTLKLCASGRLFIPRKRFNRFRIITAASTHALVVKAQGLLPLDATHPSITRLQSPLIGLSLSSHLQSVLAPHPQFPALFTCPETCQPTVNILNPC